MTDYVYEVGDGKTYATISAADTQAKTDRSSTIGAGDRVVIRCYPQSTPDSTYRQITGWTINATGRLVIEAASTARHAGIWTTSAYRLIVTEPSGYALFISSNYVTLDGLQLMNNSATGRSVVRIGGLNTEIKNCIFRANNQALSTAMVENFLSAASDNHFVNNLIYDHTSSFCWYSTSTAGTNNIYNNTFIGGGYGVLCTTSGSTINLKNNLSQGQGTAGYRITGATLNSNGKNISSTAAYQDDAAPWRSVTVTFNGSPPDYTLPSNTQQAKDNADDLSSDSAYPFSTDASGATRGASWDNGFDEYVAAGGLPLFMQSDLMQGGIQTLNGGFQ